MTDLSLLGALAVLAVVLVGVVRSDGRRSELVWAGPAAVLVVATRLVDLDGAAEAVRDLAPTLGFLAAMFVVARLADAAGLFDRAAHLLGRAAGHGDGALLAAVALGAVGVTTVLSLDATAVLFTPVVVATVRGRRRADGPLLATAFLANGASLLLPVANLTNLLALDQLDLTFPAFAARMALPTLVAALVIAVGTHLLTPPTPVTAAPVPDRPTTAPIGAPPIGEGRRDGGTASPRDAWWVAAGIGALLVALVAGSLAGLAPAAVAGAGAVLLGVVGLARRTVSPAQVARAVDVRFLAFVAALGVVVAAPAQQGLTREVDRLLPSGHGLGALLLVAFGAALLANLVTNLPAILLLLPPLAGRHPSLLLAALIGVNIGPNLTVTGSLAPLLWRRIVRTEGVAPPLRSFLRVGLVTTPLAVAGATLALWAGLRLGLG